MKKLIKKLLILTVITAIVVTAMPLTGVDFTNIISPKAKAAAKTETFTWGDYEYKIINTDEIELVNYYGKDTEVTIPSEINEMPVTSIGEYCFTGGDRPTKPDWIKHPNAENNKKIQKLVIPSSVKTIGAEAFSFIDSLSEVVLNEGLEFIDEYAFANCPNLTELKLPDSLITFSMLAVTETPVEELVFGSNVEFFTFENFAGELYVKRVVFNADVITIEGISLVPNETQLEEIVCNGGLFFTGSIKYKGSVKRIVCNGDVSYYDIVGLAGFGMEANLNALDGTIVFSEEKILLPGEHESNGFKYFVDDNSEATISRYTGGESDVTVPENLDGYPVTQIGTFAFSSLCCTLYDTDDTEDKTIPEDLITSIKLPETIESINNYAFAGNFNLKEINIPSKVTTIPYECFVDCQSLESINIPDSVNKIEGGAFYGCESLKSISLPEGITEIQDNTFNGCTALKSIEMPGVKTIGDDAFSYCHYLMIDEFPQSLTEIGQRAFLMCWSIECLDLSNVNKIGEDALFECEKLKVVTLNDNLEHLDAGIFYGCHALERITFPSKLVSIGEACFNYSGLKEAVFNEGLKTIGADAFDRCEALEKVVFPSTLVTIGEYSFRNTGLTEVVLNEGLETIESGAFTDCDMLETVTFPSTLVSIGANAFRDAGLNEVTLNEGLKTIGAGAFFDCHKITSVTLPESLEYIKSNAFYRCHGIKEITIPVNLKVLGYRAFSRCANLATVYFNATNCKVSDPRSGETYVPEDWATASPFYATKITNIYFGENITAISGDSETCGTFENCDTLEAISIPASVEEIGTAAFKNCTNLETAVIPDSVEEIADDAFFGCDNLTIYCSEQSYAYAYATANNISVSTLIISAIPNKTYTGNAIKPAVTVTVASTILTKDVDYSVSYSNNINVGQATVIVNGMGEYANFSSKANFTIVTRKINKAEINDIQPQKHTGKPVEPSLTITDNGRYLKEGKDYTVNYSNNTNQGTAYVYISGIGNYSGSVQKAFEIRELDSSEVFKSWFISFITDFFAKLTSFFSLL